MPSSGLIQVLVAILCVLPTTASTKLSNEEDIARSLTCGKAAPQSKLFEGKHIAGSHAPWMVDLFSIINSQVHFQTGFLISNRHILSTSEAFLRGNGSFLWMFNSTKADVTQCSARSMPIPQYALKGVVVHPCIAIQSGSNCQSAKAINVTNGYYIGSCEETKMAYGMIVLELEQPVDAAVPACITDKRGKIGEEVSMYGTGYAGGWTALSTRTAKVVECAMDAAHNDLSVCCDSGACGHDFGGLVSRKVDGREYALGVLWTEQCSIGGQVNHVSVPTLHGKICELTGICLSKPTMPPTPPAPTTPAPSQRPIQKHEDPDAAPVEDDEQTASEIGATESSAAMAMLPGLAILLVFSL